MDKEEILQHLEARRKGAEDAEVVANELKNKPRELVHRTRRVAFEEAIRIVKESK